MIHAKNLFTETIVQNSATTITANMEHVQPMEIVNVGRIRTQDKIGREPNVTDAAQTITR